MTANPRQFFSKEMFYELSETFDMLDDDKTGVINKQQLHLALKAFGLAENSKDALGEIGEFVDFDEYLHVFVRRTLIIFITTSNFTAPSSIKKVKYHKKIHLPRHKHHIFLEHNILMGYYEEDERWYPCRILGNSNTGV